MSEHLLVPDQSAAYYSAPQQLSQWLPGKSNPSINKQYDIYE